MSAVVTYYNLGCLLIKSEVNACRANFEESFPFTCGAMSIVFPMHALWRSFTISSLALVSLSSVIAILMEV